MKASSTKRRVLFFLQRSARALISSLVRSWPVGLFGLQIKRIFAFSRTSSGSVSTSSCLGYSGFAPMIRHCISYSPKVGHGRSTVSPFSATHSTTSLTISVEPLPGIIFCGATPSPTNLAAASRNSRYLLSGYSISFPILFLRILSKFNPFFGYSKGFPRGLKLALKSRISVSGIP
jgi:hypothetical protein